MKNKNNSFSIKDWNESDRPREKLAHNGPRALTNAELLAILIGSGNKDESAVVLCQRILAKADHTLSKLRKFTLQELMSFHGIGEAKAITVLAALELGRREKGSVGAELKKISSSRHVFDLMQPLLGDLGHEEFWILYLNNSNRILQHSQLSKGGITGTLVDARLVFKNALQLGAVGIILVHNHPSGAMEPSASDIALTSKLSKAGESLDIKVLDHVIITEKTYFSFADANRL